MIPDFFLSFDRRDQVEQFQPGILEASSHSNFYSTTKLRILRKHSTRYTHTKNNSSGGDSEGEAVEGKTLVIGKTVESVLQNTYMSNEGAT